jgi:hypothetical protein
MYEELFPDLNTRTDDKVGFFSILSLLKCCVRYLSGAIPYAMHRLFRLYNLKSIDVEDLDI